MKLLLVLASIFLLLGIWNVVDFILFDQNYSPLYPDYMVWKQKYIEHFPSWMQPLTGGRPPLKSVILIFLLGFSTFVFIKRGRWFYALGALSFLLAFYHLWGIL